MEREARRMMTELGDTEAPHPSVATGSGGGAERTEERGRVVPLKAGAPKGGPRRDGASATDGSMGGVSLSPCRLV